MKRWLIVCLLAGCSDASRQDPNADLSVLHDLATPSSDLIGVSNVHVVVNEIYPHGPSGMDPDWAELYNLGAATADLSGWQVRDNAVADLFTLPAGTTVPPGGYLVIYCDDQTDGGVPGGIHVPWKLSGTNGDELHLLSPGGEVDMTTFGAAAVPMGQSWARLPDGTGSFAPATPTRGTANMP